MNGDEGATTVLEPLVQQSTPSRIATRVREAIARGDFPPGAQLHEAELARQLGVSRGPLREGLQRLTQEGLLTSIRNRGLFVVDLTPENVRDMYLAREAIERCAAGVLVRSDPADRSAAADALEGAVEAMTESTEAGDSHGVAEADIAFHVLLVELTESERLRRIHQTQAAEARISMHWAAPTRTTRCGCASTRPSPGRCATATPTCWTSSSSSTWPTRSASWSG